MRAELKTDSDNDDDQSWDKLVGTYETPSVEPPAEQPNELLNIADTGEYDSEDLDNILQMLGMSHMRDQLKKNTAGENDSTKSVDSKSIKSKPKSKIQQLRRQSEKLTPKKLLSHKVKGPHVVWQQTDMLIQLAIKIGDEERFFLQISPTELLFQVNHEDEGETRGLALALYGVIDSRQATFEKRGLNVVINLPKVGFVEWPRLLKLNETVQNIQYNFDAFKVFDYGQLPSKPDDQNDTNSVDGDGSTESPGQFSEEEVLFDFA